MSKIKSLLANNEGRIYVYLATESVANQFMVDVENDGFTFADGVNPTDRKPANIMAVNRDNTINYVGTIGRIAYQSADKIGDEPLVKIDYEELLNNK